MALRQLPWELEEDILSRLPPQSLIRFRTVCKQWNSLLNDKSFLNNHLCHSHPQFIILTNSKIYSIDIINHDINSIDPTIELHELPSSDIPYYGPMNYTFITTCDELLFYNYRYWLNMTALWNPWLKQVEWIKNRDNQLQVVGLGYDNIRPEKVYKILCYFNFHPIFYRRVVIYECASNAFKFIGTPDEDCPITVSVRRYSNVSLNGNLYWVTSNLKTHEYFIQSFDFTTEIFKPFCLLPCQKNYTDDQPILAVYKGDRFSLLKQCSVTRKIEIWVTKKNIDREEEEALWINLMILPTTNLPCWQFDRISYFIYDKTLFMCCSDNRTGVACIYIVREDLCKKIQIDSGIVNCCHCVSTPSLISVPLFRGQIE